MQYRKKIFNLLHYTCLQLAVIICLVASIGFYGCGGGSHSSSSTPGDGDNGSDESPTVQEGVLIDSPVKGLNFKTSSQAGITDDNGTFLYLDGETIEFLLGSLSLGQTVGKLQLSPIDLINSIEGDTNPAVVNICRLLQSLDSDNNLDNGIQIDPQVINQIHGMQTDFNFDADFFYDDENVQALFDALNDAGVFIDGPRKLRSKAQAITHLRKSLGLDECSPCTDTVIELTFQYNGSSAPRVKIVQKDGEVVFDGEVSPGGQFTISGRDDTGTLSPWVMVYINNIELSRVHTGCFAPIGPGLFIGDFEIISGFSCNGGPLCPVNEDNTGDDGDDGDNDQRNTYYLDADGDGYGNPGTYTQSGAAPAGFVSDNTDCNDNDATINPGVDEVCGDDIDNDCDDALDDGCAYYYQDADKDTYGDATMCVFDSSAPAGYVDDSTDCNDENSNINPGATDICDGLDNDCDGFIDEGCRYYYRDSDSDGYGNPAIVIFARFAPAGYVINGTDCDDTEITTYPGADDLCDGKDNNCDGIVDEPAAGTADVTFAGLLEEMVNREGFILNTAPEYTSAMFSSYDRGLIPEGRDNLDFCQYVRQELIDGRNEWVLFDHEGPGAVVRIWLTAPLYQGTLRVYLNSSDTPVIEGPPDDIVGNQALVGSPLSAERSLGMNLYLPIPYACHCKITYDGDNCFQTLDPADRFYYQINYRAYAAGTTVQSFSMDDLTTYGTEIQNVQDHLSAPSMSVSAPDRTISGTPGIVLDPGESFEQPISGPGAITRLQISLDSAADVDQALRSTVLAIDFDGATRVWSPVGDFFGSGPGRYPYVTWWQEVSGDNTMTSRWVMPFQETAVIRFINLGDQQVTVSLKDTEVMDDAWREEYSMYFHATWHSRRNIPVTALTGSDWNYVTISGKGRYMGDTLTVYNRASQWWGEGDSKIWVDNDSFPSFFGTGTEDYYGYAFCGDGGTYEAPFHAQPRGEGDSRNIGYTTNTRTRSLDAIPFTSRLQVDMELWHWATTQMDYAVTCYWYAFDGATSNRVAEPDEAAAPLVE